MWVDGQTGMTKLIVVLTILRMHLKNCNLKFLIHGSPNEITMYSMSELANQHGFVI
jgi:hypothetical protein